MPDDSRYEAALAVAQAILQTLERPAMPYHEKLAHATFAILDAIRQFEQTRA